jgi:hypothetical protein
MAVETLLKICNKCKRKFVVLHPMEVQPFVAELLVSLADIIKDLKVHQVNMFYESVALMIRAEGDEAVRNQYLVRAPSPAPPHASPHLQHRCLHRPEGTAHCYPAPTAPTGTARCASHHCAHGSRHAVCHADRAPCMQDKLMELPNTRWQQTLDQVAASPPTLEAIEVQNTLHNLLQSNVSVCQSMGGFFMPQMVKLFAPMLQVYTRLSQLINNGIQCAGPLGAQHSAIKAMRSVKKTALRLIETFVDTAEMDEHLAVIRADFVPALMEPILTDYERSLPDAKCAPLLPAGV